MTGKDILISHFKQARENNSECIFISIDAEGVEEIIAIPQKSFDAKEKFYIRAYDEDLVHVMNSKVRITHVSHGQADFLKILF